MTLKTISLRFVTRHTLVLGVLWTLALGAVLGEHWVEAREHYRELSRLQGQALVAIAGSSLHENPVLSLSLLWQEKPLRNTSAGLAGLWLLGLVGIVGSGRRLHRQTRLILASEEKRSEAEAHLRYLTYFDPLTALPNRLLFQERLEQALPQVSHQDGSGPARLAVGVLGLDHFKRINNTFGHQVGEGVLKAAAERLTAALPPEDTVASLVDGRFWLLLHLDGAKTDAEQIAAELQRVLEAAFVVTGLEVFLTASVGLAVYPGDGGDAKTLLLNADAAFARAKCLGRNVLQLYAPAMNAKALEQITLENSLRRALADDQLELFYQPQVDGMHGRILGAEALLRWRNPVLGLVPPTDFIPLAEESGMILPIGQWVLRQACRQAARWRREFKQPFTMAVNLSARQFLQTDLVAMVEEALAQSGLPPECLELEITEGTIIRDVDQAIETLTALKRRGIQIAIDDFGTGYSSLNYLKKFPIDRIKIDRSFVADIHTRNHNNVIISSIVSLAKKMGLKVIAEGVENEGQKAFLLSLGCRDMQGFYYSRPLEVARLEELLHALETEQGECFSWWMEAGRFADSGLVAAEG